MTPADREYLRSKAAALAPAGCRYSQLTLWLLSELEPTESALRTALAITDAMAERIHGQHEIIQSLALRPAIHPCA